MTCTEFRGAVFALDDPMAPLSAGSRLFAHAHGCSDCRAWLARYREGVALVSAGSEPGFATAVLARTAGAACEQARVLMAGAVETALAADDETLVLGHVASCSSCAEFRVELAAVRQALPLLAELDPGQWFAEQVYARTSRQSPAERQAARWAAAWARLVARPRFAFEVAYVCTVLLVVAFGRPLSAMDWTTAPAAAVERVTSASSVRLAKAKVDGLRTNLRAGAAETGRGLAGGGEVTVAKAESSWQRLTGALMSRATAVLDAVTSTWHAVVTWWQHWFGPATPEPAGSATTTEPGSGPVR
jgi:hypothetical protein